MAPRKVVETEDEILDDEVWAKLQTENRIPPLTFRGITLVEPSKRQVDAWRAASTPEDGELALWGAELTKKIHDLFADEPEHVWDNFNLLYLRHFFGIGVDAALKG